MPESDRFSRLAALVSKLGARRRETEYFRDRVEPLRQGGLEPVEGEVEILRDLELKLEDCFTRLAAFSAATGEADLETLEDTLEDVIWGVAQDLLPDVEEKFRRQDELLKKLIIDVKEWENRLTSLARVIDGARNDGAAFSHLEVELGAARSGVQAVRSALTDRIYRELPVLQSSVQTKVNELEAAVRNSQPQVTRVKKLVKQADLLIMQVGSDRQDYEYRVLLRSADRSQTRGINIIQDQRPLSRADRDWIVGQLTQLTTRVNQGLRAAHAAVNPGLPRTILPADPTQPASVLDTSQALATLGEFLFRMVIPEQMQKYLRRNEWSFSITTNDLQLPWELVCFDAADGDSSAEPQFLCLARSVSRMPLGEVFPPAQQRRTIPGAGGKRRMLLIHSDPEGNLPAAGREVETIARQLAGDLEFERVDPDRATNANLNEILMKQSFDFIHYAGHAYFDKDNPIESGLQLKDSRLTARKIRLLSKGGSLVFLNACESGTVASDSQPQQVSYLLRNPEPVVGLASAFVYSGALGCIGSLWPVYDQPAADLAVSFYRHVLAGEPTGEALRLARSEIRAAHPREITWAAYVLYGDPTYRLTES